MTPKLALHAQTEPDAPSGALGEAREHLQLAPNINVEEAGHVEMAHLIQRVFMSSEQAPRQVLFCSVDEQDGSTSVCARVGRLLAAQGAKTVCMVDANTRQPRLSNLYGVPSARPFGTRTHSPLPSTHRIDTNLWLVGAEAAVGRVALSSATNTLPVHILKEQLIRLRGEYDYVLIDAPAMRHSEDAAVLGSIVDGAILVVRAGMTRRIAARRAKQTLEDAGVSVLGAVLHDRVFPIPEAIYRRL